MPRLPIHAHRLNAVTAGEFAEPTRAAATMHAAPEPFERRRASGQRFDRLACCALSLVALCTRLPLLANTYGEADTARFVTGLRQWLAGGPHAPGIYSNVFCAGYYWLCAHLAAWGQVRPEQLPLFLNALSAAAAVITAPLAYLVGRRIAADRWVAAVAAVLFVFAPAVWWLGIEPHPQALSMAAFLLSMYAWLRAWHVDGLQPCELGGPVSLKWCVISLLALTVSLLFKSDIVLAFGAFPAALVAGWLAASPTAFIRRYWRGWLRAFSATAAMLASASLAFVAVRQIVLGEALRRTQHSAGREVGYFFEIPLGVEFLKQVAPMLFAAGLLVTAFIAAGLLFVALRRQIQASAYWGVTLLAWAAPGCVFWLLIRGNNTRHLALYILPFLWAACVGWKQFGRRALLSAAAVALGLGFWVVPPSSNITLYPSADVPASARLLRAREVEMSQVASRLRQAGLARAPRARGADVPVCYIGSYTTPYIVDALVSAAPTIRAGPVGRTTYRETGLVVAKHWTRVHIENPRSESGSVELYTLEPGLKITDALARCGTALTLEFNPDGTKRWYQGSEIRHPWQMSRQSLPLTAAVALP